MRRNSQAIIRNTLICSSKACGAPLIGILLAHKLCSRTRARFSKGPEGVAAVSLRFLVAAFVVATTARAQAVVTAASGPAVSGVVRDSSGTPIADAEVAVLRGNRLQQFMI